MSGDSISEAQFLVIELRYTLSQMQAQLAYLGDPLPAGAVEILEQMATAEQQHLSTYARLLRVPDPPVNRHEHLPSTVVKLRETTIAMMESVDGPWQQELLDVARKHVGADRAATTRLADLRTR